MRFVLILITAVLFITCRQEVVEEPFQPAETYDQYLEALSRLELDETLLGSSWREAGTRAMREPALVEPPIEEVLFFDPHEPRAATYHFPLRRGRRVTIEIETEVEQYFADLFRVPEEGVAEEEPELVATRSAGVDRIELEARRDRFYLLRVQPELLRGGRFRIRIVTEASLAFPVQDTGPESILSFYGDSRGGGTRIHEGIDIFAPRGTPLLAASDSVVYRVGRRDRGGNIVSLLDEDRNLLLYYAHLEEQLVRQGDRVSAGDVVGTVGNTGNAIRTPPHLHIGVYQGGWRNPVDPWEYFVDPPKTTPAPVKQDDRIDQWYRIARDVTVMRALPPPEVSPRYVNRNPFLFSSGTTIGELGLRDRSAPHPETATLPEDTAVQVIGSVGDHLRVRTIDGAYWFLDHPPVLEPGEPGTFSRDTILRDPLSGDSIARVPRASARTTLGRAGEEELVVELPSGRVGLVPLDS